MCLLLVSSNGFSELSDDLLAAALRHNPHGAGLMWHDGRSLHTRRQRYIGQRGIREWLSALPSGAKAALHLRKATCGSRNLDNVHPHELRSETGRLCVMHNGSLDPWVGCPRRSDTARFTQEWLAPAWQAEPDITSLKFGMQLRAAVPQGNRLVLADSAGRWRVVGEEEGWWCDGMWLSNPKARNW